MNERHKISVTSLVVGGLMVAMAALGRSGVGWGNLARWPWLFGSVLVVLGILLVLGALREDADAADADLGAVAPAGISDPPFEFQEHESSESDNVAE
ncbi:MAG: hypothetical protein IIB04_06950 [Acidobacteria bacterium]|nr:hypothetical protein [Acidobacteriota bacterium]